MIFQIPELTDKDKHVMRLIDDLKKKLKYVTASSPRRWYGRLRRTTLARNVLGSNSIEGYNVSKDDALAAVEGVEPIDDKTKHFRANRAYSLAMTYVLQLADDPHFTYSADLIRSLHYMMLEYDLEKSPGKWRPGPINVYDEEKKEVVYEAPDVDLVPGLIKELVDSLNEQEANKTSPRIITAAMGHLNLVMIHPFRDGNGRMSRCLQTLILVRGATLDPIFSSIEEYLGSHSRSYYDVLQQVGLTKWDPGRDAAPWIRYCLQAHYYQAATYLQRFNNSSRLWENLEKEVKHLDLNERMVTALFDAAIGWKVRNAIYRAAVDDISDQVASRDLKELVRAGLLISYGNARGRYYEAADRIKLVASEILQKKPIADPYAAGSSPAVR